MTDMAIAEFQDSEQDLRERVELALRLASQRGSTAAEVSSFVDSGLDLSIRNQQVETLERTRDRGFSVTVYFGQRRGHASTSDMSRQSIEETIQAACDIARYTEEDPYSGLAPAERMAREFPDYDQFAPWPLDSDDAIRLACECEAAAMAIDSRIDNSDGASINTHAGMRVYGNSHGFFGARRGTSHSISCGVLARDAQGMQRDYWYDTRSHADDLQAVETIGRIAGERVVSRLNARRLSTREAPVLFSPEVSRGLISHFIAGIRGTAQYRESSYLLGAVGERIFPEFVSIEERPHLRRALGSSPFDDEGVATCDSDLLRNGVVSRYVLGSYSARRLGLETTGNAGGLRNVMVNDSGQTFAELCRQMGTGLLVTEMMGQGVNIVTGDYSRGAAGFWIENGEIAWPVEEITIAGNLRQMFAGIEAIGSDRDDRGNIQCGSILVNRMMIAGE